MRFSYVAQDKYKKILRGELEATSKEEALELLTMKGFSTLKLDPTLSEQLFKKSFFKGFARFAYRGHLNTLDQITIIRHLGTILNTGTDLLAGLDIIANDAIKPLVRTMLHDIRGRISQGERFSDALLPWRDHFPPVFVNLVRAGESSGNLPAVLLAYTQELRKDYAFMRKLKGALVYPAILVSALGVMVVLILTVVTPRLKEVFAATKAAPPFYTRFFFAVSDFWLQNLFPILIAGGIFVFLVLLSLQSIRIRRKVGSFFLHFPVVNKIQKSLILMRFCKTMASLIDAGFPLKAAILTTSDVVGEKYHAALKVIAEEKIERGIPLSQAIREYKHLFPGVLASVVATGEKSGQLSQVFAQMGDFYSEDVAYSLELFLTLIEPILLVIVGVVVGLMAVSLISPLYNLIGKIR